MKLKFVAAALTVVLATCGAFAQTHSSKTNEAIDGVWRGQMGDLPFITLVMTDEPGSFGRSHSVLLSKARNGERSTDRGTAAAGADFWTPIRWQEPTV
jgi:hypothetical protein